MSEDLNEGHIGIPKSYDAENINIPDCPNVQHLSDYDISLSVHKPFNDNAPGIL